MFQDLKPLDPQQDGELCLTGGQTYAFAASQMLIPIVVGEAGSIAREYPIVFADSAGQLPLALVGIEQGTNGHVLASGQWQGRYIPAHIRRYPFMLIDVTQDASANERRMAIAVDRAAPHLDASGNGTLLFEGGQPSPTLRNIEKILVQIHQDGERTKYQTRQLEELGLLVSQPIVLKPRAGQGVELNGLRLIDRERFGALTAEQLHSLHKTGALTLAHAHFLSLTNLNDGFLAHLLEQKAGYSPDPDHDLDLDEFFGEGGDTIKFDFH